MLNKIDKWCYILISSVAVSYEILIYICEDMSLQRSFFLCHTHNNINSFMYTFRHIIYCSPFRVYSAILRSYKNGTNCTVLKAIWTEFDGQKICTFYHCHSYSLFIYTRASLIRKLGEVFGSWKLSAKLHLSYSTIYFCLPYFPYDYLSIVRFAGLLEFSRPVNW